MSTQVESSTQTQEHIAAARARAAAKYESASAQSAREAAARKTAQDVAWRQNLAWLAQWLPAWMLEYVERQDYQQYGTHDCVWDRVLLPGCCPIELRHYGSRFDHIHILRPMGVEYNMDADDIPPWYVKVDLYWSMDDLDLAIDDAAQYGESWHEMSLEAARRNEQGLRPEPPAPAIPDPIEQARELVSMLSSGANIAQHRYADVTNDDRALVLAGVGLAIAFHVQRIADTLEQRTQPLPF